MQAMSSPLVDSRSRPPLPSSTIALWLAWVLFWALMTATAVQEYLRDFGQQPWKPVLWTLTSALTVTILLYLQRRHTRRHDGLIGSPLRWFRRQLVWLPVYWIAFTPLAFAMRHAIYALAGEAYTHEGWLDTLVYENVKMTVFFFATATITFGMLSYTAMQNEKLRLERAQASLQEMQLLRLSQQLQPHFLFNALNTISALMYSDVARADAMLMQLADLLRATLDIGERHQAPLATELQLLRAYAALMSERFADRVSVAWEIDDSVLDHPVPVMCLQPLLENVFKHTVEQRRQATAIRIGARRVQGQLLLWVEDDGGVLAERADGAGSAVAGIGIRNLRARLDSAYGAAAGFTLTQLKPAGVRAQITLPCAS